MGEQAIAMVMLPGLESRLLTTQAVARIGALATTFHSAPFPKVDAIPHDVAASISVLLTGWGCPPIGAAELAHLPNLKLVAHAAGTVKGLVTPELYERKVIVTSAADANAIPVAEFTTAAIVIITKKVFEMHHMLRSSRGEDLHARLFDTMINGQGIGNRGNTIGLVGGSRIGKLVAARLQAFDCEVLIYDPYLSADDAAALGAEKVKLDDLCSRSHIVSLHAPALPETHHMIGGEQLKRIESGGWLLNTARGSLVDTDAITHEAEAGRLNFFLDTTDPEPLPPESPLYDLPNVILTPHIAGSLGNEISRMGDAAVNEIERFMHGETPLFPVLESDLNLIA